MNTPRPASDEIYTNPGVAEQWAFSLAEQLDSLVARVAELERRLAATPGAPA